jgi:nucleoside-diphosphate-sugar epimerase
MFTSSISLHGDIPGDTVDENTGRINTNHYGLSKYLCELVLQEYQNFFPVAALRLCGVVGPNAKNVWLSKVLSNARRGEPISIVNRDRAFNNIVHIDDLLDFLLRLMECGFSGFHAFPMASSAPRSIRDVVTEIIEATHSSSEIIDNGTTENSFVISNEYAMREFGYEPSTVSANLKKYASV